MARTYTPEDAMSMISEAKNNLDEVSSNLDNIESMIQSSFAPTDAERARYQEIIDGYRATRKVYRSLLLDWLKFHALSGEGIMELLARTRTALEK